MEFLISLNRNIIDKSGAGRAGWQRVRVSEGELAAHVKAGYAFMPGVVPEGWNGAKPKADDICGAYLAVLDIDSGVRSFADALEDEFIKSNALMLYTTAGSTPERNRYRIVFHLPAPVAERSAFTQITRKLIARFGADKACTNFDRLYYGNRNAEIAVPGKKMSTEALVAVLGAGEEELETVVKNSGKDLSPEDVRHILSFIPSGEGAIPYEEWLKVVSGVGNYFDEATATALVEAWSPDSRGTAWRIRNRLRTVAMGSVIYIAKKYGYNPDRLVVKTVTSGDVVRKDKVQRRDVSGSIITGDRLWGELVEIYNNSFESGALTGWHNFDKLIQWESGMFTVVTGTPGSGKSTFVDNLMVNLSVTSQWKWGYFSPENKSPAYHFRRMCEQFYGKGIICQPQNKMTPDELQFSKNFLSQYMYEVLPDNEDYSLDNILTCAAWLADTQKINGFVIDPWNTIENKRAHGENESDYVCGILKTIKNFARKYGIHIILVAHPRKMELLDKENFVVPAEDDKLGNKEILAGYRNFERGSLYSISGSAHFYNICDNGIIIYRGTRDGREFTEVSVDKVKNDFAGRLGRVYMHYCRTNNRFYEGLSTMARDYTTPMLSMEGEINDIYARW